MKYRHVLLATTVVSAIALPQIVNAFDGTGRIIVAQKEDPKKKQQQQPKPQPKQVQPPPKQQVQPQPKPAPQQKQVQPPPRQMPPPAQKQVQPPPQKQLPPAQKQVQPPPQKGPPLQQQTTPPQKGPPLQQQTTPPQKGPPLQQQTTPPQKGPPLQQQTTPPQKGPPLQQQTTPPQKGPPLQQQTTPPQKGPPLQQQTTPPQKGPPLQQQTVPTQKGPPIQQQVKQPPVTPQKFGAPKVAPATQVGNVKELKGKREEQRQGNTVIIREPGNRTIIRENNRIVIRHDESERMRRWGNARFETRGQERFTIVNRGGYDVVTITDPGGRMLRRYRRFPDGREYALIDNRRRWGGAAIAAGAVVGGAIVLGLAMPRITIPRERYIVDMESAPPAYLYEALEAPPLVAMERPYSLDEVRDNYELRARVRSVDINSINFASGSWEISPDQVARLQGLADAMLKVIGENPSTVFLIEGHTDAVGSPEDNASLSDRRAEAVAEALTTSFNVPPENLVTQGYGEQHLRVQTDGPSRENRRVEVRNVTGLMAADQADQGGQQGGPPDGLPPGQRPPG